MLIQRGGRGSGPPSSWKITSCNMGFCREYAIAPTHPRKKLDPPPPPWKCWTPPAPWKEIFSLNLPLDFYKISWGLKKTVVIAFFLRLTWTPPDENSWIRAWYWNVAHSRLTCSYYFSESKWQRCWSHCVDVHTGLYLYCSHATKAEVFSHWDFEIISR